MSLGGKVWQKETRSLGMRSWWAMGPGPASSSDLLLAHVSTLPAMCFYCEVLSWHSHPTRVGGAETSLPLTKAIAVIVSLRGPRITKETSLAVPVKECLQPNVTVRSAPQTEPRLESSQRAEYSSPDSWLWMQCCQLPHAPVSAPSLPDGPDLLTL